eukprot:7334586-Pyramimonas_sp.AAC.1
MFVISVWRCPPSGMRLSPPGSSGCRHRCAHRRASSQSSAGIGSSLGASGKCCPGSCRCKDRASSSLAPQ